MLYLHILILFLLLTTTVYWDFICMSSSYSCSGLARMGCSCYGYHTNIVKSSSPCLTAECFQLKEGEEYCFNTKTAIMINLSGTKWIYFFSFLKFWYFFIYFIKYMPLGNTFISYHTYHEILFLSWRMFISLELNSENIMC